VHPTGVFLVDVDETRAHARWHRTCLHVKVEKWKSGKLKSESEESPMTDRMLAGGLAGVAATLTLVQLLWMFRMFSPADALGGRNGAMYASMLAGWFFGTFALLVAAALILLMTSDKRTRA
jgi:hypothetical protein